MSDPIEVEIYRQPENHITLAEYISECESALGKLPETIDCDDVSQSVNDLTGVKIEPINQTIKQDIYKGKSISYPTCDNPTFAIGKFDGCRENSYYDRKTNADGSVFITLCRFAKKNREVPEVEVGAMIGHQPKTGATCFFKYKDDTPWSISGELPGPGRPQSGKEDDPRRVWETPGFITNMPQGTCVNCHSAYPWIRNPHTFLPGANGDAVVPYNTNPERVLSTQNSMPIRNDTRYFVVARERLERLWITDFNDPNQQQTAHGTWTPVVLDINPALLTKFPELKMCSGCHRLGQGRNLRFWSPSAFGIYENLAEIYMKPMFSNAMITFPRSVWHPVEYGSMKSDFSKFHRQLSESENATEFWKDAEQEWKMKYGPVLNVLANCDRNPNECSWRTLPELNGLPPPLPSQFANQKSTPNDSNQEAHD